MRVALYLRVSTTKGQTTDNQRLELERWAAARGYTIVKTYEDYGISGAKGRDKRPALDAMLNGASRRTFDMVAAWSVDRIGRSMVDLVNILLHLRATGCGLYLHQQSLDTSTPAGEAMFGMSAVFAQYDRAMTVARVHAGLDRARAQGKVLGRPTIASGVRDLVLEGLRAGRSIRQVVKLTGTSVGTVAKLRKELMSDALAAA